MLEPSGEIHRPMRSDCLTNHLPLPARPSSAPKDWQPPVEARLPALEPEGYGDAGIPVVVVEREAARAVMAKLESGASLDGALRVSLSPEKTGAENVVARIAAGAPDGERLPGVVVIGAHYDHLGMGGRYSLAPERKEPHLGADDNASGVAALLEIARALTARRSALKRDVVLVAFSGEESGLFGSTFFTRHAAMADMVAMLNLDKVCSSPACARTAPPIAPACAAATSSSASARTPSPASRISCTRSTRRSRARRRPRWCCATAARSAPR